MKLSRVTKIGMVTVSGLLLVWVALIVFSSTSSTKTGPAQVDPTRCPECGSKYNKAGECPRCMAEEGVEAYRAKRAKKDGFASSPVIPTVLGCLLFLLLATHIGINVRARKKNKKEEVYYHVRCSKCGRKLRYRETQIERLGRCPLCQKPLRFPRPPEKPKVSRWVKIAHVAHLIWD
jgi:predicted Zn-ribbon and HTH transcriptional regulator